MRILGLGFRSLLNAPALLGGFTSRYFTTVASSLSQHWTTPTVTLAADFEIEFEFQLVGTPTNETILGQSGGFATFIHVTNDTAIRARMNNINITFTVPSLGSLLHSGKLTRVSGVPVLILDGVSFPEDSLLTNSGTVTYDLIGQKSASEFFNGILADIRITDAGTLIRKYNIDENWIGPSTVLKDTSGNGQDGTFVNGTSDDAELFTRNSDGDWINAFWPNFQEFSEEFDKAVWTKLNNTISANSATAPDGTLTADKVIPSAVNNAKSLFQASSITTGVDYTQSDFVKADGYDFVQIAASTGFDLFTTWVNIDVSTGTIGNRGAGSIGKVQIQSLPNGWFRVSLTSTATSTTSGGFLLQVLDSDINARLPAFTGDGVSGVNMWGAQLNEGQLMPYKKTTDVIGRKLEVA